MYVMYIANFMAQSFYLRLAPITEPGGATKSKVAIHRRKNVFTLWESGHDGAVLRNLCEGVQRVPVVRCGRLTPAAWGQGQWRATCVCSGPAWWDFKPLLLLGRARFAQSDGPPCMK